jgi:hypothetical protein
MFAVHHDAPERPWENRSAMAAEDDRPTLYPAFDVETYARESDKRIRSAAAASNADAALGEGLVEASDASDDDAEQIYWACLGGRDRVPVLTRPLDELLSVPRTAAEGLVLSFLDGRRTIAAVIEASGLPTPVALLGLYDLLDRDVIALRVLE